MAGFRGRVGSWQANDCLFLLFLPLIPAHSGPFLAKSLPIPRAEFPSAKREGASMTAFTESVVEQAALAWL